MMRFALLAALASAAHAGFNLEKPTGEVFFHAKNGLGADKVGAGAKAKAKLGDGAEVGGELEFNADEVKPEKVWLQYSKKVDDMETDASVVYNFNDEGTAVNLDVETPSAFFQDAKTRLGMTLAQRVPGFIRELRLKQQLSPADGQTSTIEASYDPPRKTAEATLRHAVGKGTEVELQWKQERNQATLRWAQSVSQLGCDLTPEIDLRSGAARVELHKQFDDDSSVKVDVGNDKVRRRRRRRRRSRRRSRRS